jgi:hypothetical protein
LLEGRFVSAALFAVSVETFAILVNVRCKKICEYVMKFLQLVYLTDIFLEFPEENAAVVASRKASRRSGT